MDDSFPVEFWQSDLFWLETAPIPASLMQTTAFVPYPNQLTDVFGQQNSTTVAADTAFNALNVNRRMIEFSRKSWNAKREEPAAAAGGCLEKEKCHRHMLNERMRREKQRQSYISLHSMLPRGTKNNKNSIVQMAARTIQELKSYEDMLQRKNLELETTLAAKRERENGTVIKLAMANPSSGINSMLAVLNVLKTVGVNATAIHASFFDAEFSAQLAVDTHVRAAEVERTLQMTLSEAERKFRGQRQEGWNGSRVILKESHNSKQSEPRGGSRI